MTADTSIPLRLRCHRSTGCQSRTTDFVDSNSSLRHLPSPFEAWWRCRDPLANLLRVAYHFRQGSCFSRLLWHCFAIWTLLYREASCTDNFVDGDVAAAIMDVPREILFDTRAAPMAVVARQEASIPSTTIAASSASATTGSSSQAISQTTSAPFTLPSPFDHSLGNNFTSSTCPSFFSTFLSDPDFENCRPLSLLLGVSDRPAWGYASQTFDLTDIVLQTSEGFFAAQRSPIELSRTLDATCNVNFNQCQAIMAKYARAITQSSNCGADYQLQNPSVLQAYNGFLAYQPLYTAGCLKDPRGQYCFAAAAANSTAYQNNYVYYLPLGTQLSGGAQPACTQCLHDTMSVFAQAATNKSQPLHMDYESAARQLDINCGPTFVQAALQSTASATHLPSSSSGLFALFITFFALVWSLIR